MTAPITMPTVVINALVRALQMIADECQIEERFLGASHQDRALKIATQALRAVKEAGYDG